MCLTKGTLLNLCQLFPQTAENIQRKALERRAMFMRHRKQNSKRHGLAQGLPGKSNFEDASQFMAYKSRQNLDSEEQN